MPKPTRTLPAWAAAICLTGCASYNTAPTDSIDKTKFGSDSGTRPNPAAETTVATYAGQMFAYDLLDSAKDPTTNTKALKAFRTGKAFIDLQCNAYLDALGTANQRAANERKQVNLIGGTVAAIGGLAEATAKEIAISSTLFSFAGASMDGFTQAHLFSDAAKSISKLVRTAQHEYIKALPDNYDAHMDYPAAVALLTGYESLCRPSEIRRLVDEAITAAKLVPEDNGALLPSGELALLLSNLMQITNRPVSESDAIVLYAFYANPDRRTQIAASSGFITTLKNSTKWTDDELASKLSSPFLPLSIKGNAVASRWARTIDSVPGLKDKPAAGAPAAAASSPATAASSPAAAASSPAAAASAPAVEPKSAITLTAPRIGVQQFR